MKRVWDIFLLALFLTLLLTSLSFAATPSKETKFEKMLAPRTTICWVEGVAMDELVIGARAKMVFVCVDGKLGGEIVRLRPEGSQEAEYYSVPQWLRTFSDHYTKQKGKTLFAMQFVTAKPWDFDMAKIRVGDHYLQREDILLDDKFRQILPAGETLVPLPGDFSGRIAFYVPSGLLKPGSEIEIGYDESIVVWKVPKN